MKVFIQAVETRLPYIDRAIRPALAKVPQLETPELFIDYKRQGALWNGCRIWKAIAEEDGPVMALQDDVVLHSSLADVLPGVMAHIKSGQMHAVSLFAPPRKVMDTAYEQGFNYVENYDFLWLQATILTPHFCRGLSAYIEEHPATHSHDDVLLGDYIKLSGIPIWNTLPSLVQHDLNVKSTLGTGKSCGGILRRSRVWSKELAPDHFDTVKSKRNGKPRAKAVV